MLHPTDYIDWKHLSRISEMILSQPYLKMPSINFKPSDALQLEPLWPFWARLVFILVSRGEICNTGAVLRGAILLALPHIHAMCGGVSRGPSRSLSLSFDLSYPALIK